MQFSTCPVFVLFCVCILNSICRSVFCDLRCYGGWYMRNFFQGNSDSELAAHKSLYFNLCYNTGYMNSASTQPTIKLLMAAAILIYLPAYIWVCHRSHIKRHSAIVFRIKLVTVSWWDWNFPFERNKIIKYIKNVINKMLHVTKSDLYNTSIKTRFRSEPTSVCLPNVFLRDKDT